MFPMFLWTNNDYSPFVFVLKTNAHVRYEQNFWSALLPLKKFREEFKTYNPYCIAF